MFKETKKKRELQSREDRPVPEKHIIHPCPGCNHSGKYAGLEIPKDRRDDNKALLDLLSDKLKWFGIQVNGLDFAKDAQRVNEEVAAVCQQKHNDFVARFKGNPKGIPSKKERAKLAREKEQMEEDALGKTIAATIRLTR